MRDYELTIVINPEITPAKQKQVIEKTKKFLLDLKGEIDDFVTWGKKSLAYPIKKQDSGVYFFAHLKLSPTAPAKLNQFLRVEENLLRYLLVQVKIQKSKVKKNTKKK